jgi:hypothetical protein
MSLIRFNLAGSEINLNFNDVLKQIAKLQINEGFN